MDPLQWHWRTEGAIPTAQLASGAIDRWIRDTIDRGVFALLSESNSANSYNFPSFASTPLSLYLLICLYLVSIEHEVLCSFACLH